MSSLKVDNITGRGSTGFTGSVKSEGGNTTTDLQQGLCKHFSNYDPRDQILHSSFNQSSITDHALGDISTFYTNVMSSAEDRCVLLSIWNSVTDGVQIYSETQRAGSNIDQAGDTAQSTTRVNYHTYYQARSNSDGQLDDFDASYCATFGDLA